MKTESPDYIDAIEIPTIDEIVPRATNRERISDQEILLAFNCSDYAEGDETPDARRELLAHFILQKGCGYEIGTSPTLVLERAGILRRFQKRPNEAWMKWAYCQLG